MCIFGTGLDNQQKLCCNFAASMLVGLWRRKAFGYTAYILVQAEELLSSISWYDAVLYFAALLLPAISLKDHKYLAAWLYVLELRSATLSNISAHYTN